MASRKNQLRAQAEKWTDERSGTDVRYARAPDFPGYNQTSIPDNEIIEAFPDAQSLDSAKFALSIRDEIRQRPENIDIEEKVAEIVDRLSKEEISALPRSMRSDFMVILDDDAIKSVPNLFDLRFKIMSSGFQSGVLGLDPEYVQYRYVKEMEFKSRIEQELSANPEMQDIRDRWAADPDSVDNDEKLKYLEFRHNIHAEIYEYEPANIRFSRMKDDRFGEYRSYKDEIRINRSKTTSLEEAELTIDHESMHAAQYDWIIAGDSIGPDDPRFDFIMRAAAFFETREFGNFDRWLKTVEDPLVGFNILEQDAYLGEEESQMQYALGKAEDEIRTAQETMTSLGNDQLSIQPQQ